MEQRLLLLCVLGSKILCPPGPHGYFPLLRAVFSRFNGEKQKLEPGSTTNAASSRLVPAELEGTPFKAPMPPRKTLCPYKSQMPKSIPTHNPPCWVHPALHTMGRMRPHPKVAQ